MDELTPRSRRSLGSLLFGFALLAVGGLLLAGNLGYDVPRRFWNYWPFLLMALGLARLLRPVSPDERRGGFWLLVVGLYGWINIWHLFGLDWGRSWPIFVVAAGLTILVEGLGGQRHRRRREVQRVS